LPVVLLRLGDYAAHEAGRVGSLRYVAETS
jgi:hypothetical protein